LSTAEEFIYLTYTVLCNELLACGPSAIAVPLVTKLYDV